MKHLLLVAACVVFCPEALPAETPQHRDPARSGCNEAPEGDASPFLCVPAEEQFGAGSIAVETAGRPAEVPTVKIPLVLSEGTPLRIAIDRRARIGRAGETIEGHVVETLYAFDEPVIPAGSIALGHITEVAGVPKLRRMRAYASGNLSPVREYKVAFDRLRLPGGREIAIHTTVSPGSAEVVHLLSKGSQAAAEEHKSAASRATEKAKQEVEGRLREAKDTLHRAEDQIREPGRLHRLKQFVAAQSPYRRQYLTEGTRFNAALNEPLDFGCATRSLEQLTAVGSQPPSEALLHARLVLEVSSATAKRGSPVLAELTEPLYSPDHQLLLPAESRLIGRVLEARPARSLHRNGELRVIFEHLEVPGGPLQQVQGSLEGIEVDRSARMKLDEEGGARTSDSKTRYLSTGVAILLTAAAAHTDVEHDGSVDQAGDPAVRAGAGASGFGLAGTLISLAAKSQPVSIAFSAYGASASLYANFLSRGREVVLPKDAPLEIGLGLRRPAVHR
jgi:hypothetical protein